MKAIILNLVLVFSITNMVLSSDGWQELTWGMTMEDVKGVYPKAAQKKQPSKYTLKGVDYISPLRIDEYEIAGRIYFVDFLFDPDRTLSGVTLGTPKEGGLEKGSLKIEYDNLRDLLTQKYGSPIRIEPLGDGAEYTVWDVGRTEIRLNYIRSEILRESGIRIGYLNKRIDQLDKL